MNRIEQEALDFRQEHKDLSAKKGKASATFRERFENPRLLNKAAAYIAIEAGAGLGTTMRLAAGPRVTHRAEVAIDAYEANIQASTAHLDQHLPQYVEMAKAEMETVPPILPVEPPAPPLK